MQQWMWAAQLCVRPAAALCSQCADYVNEVMASQANTWLGDAISMGSVDEHSSSTCNCITLLRRDKCMG